jgi:hypothetical protein
VAGSGYSRDVGEARSRNVVCGTGIAGDGRDLKGSEEAGTHLLSYLCVALAFVDILHLHLQLPGTLSGCMFVAFGL